jgi:regulator of protease activity HflC (stomatin/prohibitin superfamily)
MDALSDAGATTVYDGPLKPFDQDDATTYKSSHRKRGSESKRPAEPPLTRLGENLDYMAEHRDFFVKIGSGGLLEALEKLDRQLVAAGHAHLLSNKNPVAWLGKEVTLGRIGKVSHGGLPKILTKAGRYPPFPFRNWWAREFVGTNDISDTVIEFNGLTVVQVSQNQAAVVSDPQNKIFVVKNGGFVALALQGSYDVLNVVDQTHLSKRIIDHTTQAILGYTHEVKMRCRTGVGNATEEFVVATFLDIPANNCAILQKGDELEVLPAGQHYITNPNITLRKLFTKGECQTEMPTKDLFTRDQVPVSLTIYLKWQLIEPLKLTQHGYDTPYDALRDKAQSILTQIIAHLDYSSMVKQRSIDPNDVVEDGSDPSSAFLDALRTRAMDDLHNAALEYGIVLKDLAVIDRQFKGDIASTMDKLTTRALQAQVEAANVDRENSNRVKKEQGALQVAQVQASSRKTAADAEAYAVVAGARAQAEALQIAAQAQAEATRLAARAEADAIRLKAMADGEVVDTFAREMELRRIEVDRVAAYGNKTVFMPMEPSGGNSVQNAMTIGYAASLGNSMRASGEVAKS